LSRTAERGDVRLPTADSVAEFRRTATDLFFEAAWELGEYYDEKLRPILGDAWVADISAARGERRPFALHDPVFALKEPSHYSDSRIRLCLPKEGRGELLDAMDDLLKLRNGWIHASIRPSAEQLRLVAATTIRVAEPLGLLVEGQTRLVLERLDAIERGEAFASDELDELRRRLAETERAVAALEAGAATSQRELQSALAARDEALAGLAFAEKTREPPPALPPGSIWDYPRGERRLRLSRLGDVVDPETLEPFNAPDGRDSRQLGGAWLEVIPAGGDLWLDEFGNVTTHLQEHLVLLDNVTGQATKVEIGDPAPGFLLPGSFELRADGTITDRSTGSTLEEVRGDLARHVGERLLANYAGGGKIALTSTGHVAADINDRWTTIGHVTTDEWFRT
jgi:hypothetical protein